MAQRNRRRVALVLLALLLLLFFLRCRRDDPAVPERDTAPPVATDAPSVAEPALPAPTTSLPDEVLTTATLTAPERVGAGSAFAVAWTGPDNEGDYVTIVPADAPEQEYGSYRETREGPTLELTAPIDPGACEVRYVTKRSRKVLGRRPLEVVAAQATLDAADEVVMGATLTVAWTGPDNEGDYVTVVPDGTPDDQYGNYVYTAEGSPIELRSPTVSGAAELRYVSGQGRRVLARRPVSIVVPDVSLAGPDEAVAGARIPVEWTGPDNPGDYVTVVAADTPDGQYGNYTYTTSGSPLELLTPVLVGAAELRYMTGQGNRVLARRALRLVAAEITLSAPDEAAAGSAVSITWTGPNHGGDYLTIVPQGTPEGQYADYAYTTSGSPLSVKAPAQPGDAEIRYVAGQGGKVLARRTLRVVP